MNARIPINPNRPALTYSWKAILFRILLVDPNSAISTATRAALAEAGHRVKGVSTFEAATLQLAPDCPDLLITAVRLGAFNGMHLLLRFRAEHPDVPVVVIGAPGDLTPDIRRHATRSLSPPIDRESFVDAVSELLAGRTPHDPHSRRRSEPVDQLRSRSQSPVFGRLLSAAPKRPFQPTSSSSGAHPALIAWKSD